MLVARVLTHDNRNILLLGLSAENRRRLVLGSPIELNLGELDGTTKLVIFAGETEDTMQAELISLIGANSTVSSYRSRSEVQ